jgi:hypothetical protein
LQRFTNPASLAPNASGNRYVADTINMPVRIRACLWSGFSSGARTYW